MASYEFSKMPLSLSENESVSDVSSVFDDTDVQMPKCTDVHVDDTDTDMEHILKNYMEVSCVIAWTLLCLCALGIISNIISIIIYTHPSMRRTPINVLLTGLSVIDLCLSCLSIPAYVLPGLYASNNNNQLLELLMGYSQVYVYPLTSMTYTASVWTFVVIAMERWHAVCGGGSVPMASSNQSLLRRKRWRSSAYALATVCLVSFAYNFIRFFEFRLVFHDDVNDTIPMESNETLTYPKLSVVSVLKNSTIYPEYMSVYYVGLFLVTHFTVPFIALLILNGLTLRTVYLANKRRRRLLTRRERKEHRTTWMMISVVVIFVVCYSLVFTLTIVEAVDEEWFYEEENKMMSFALNDISNLLVVLNSATTAFIYLLFNRRYRELCVTLMAKWFACCWCCCWDTRNRYCDRDQSNQQRLTRLTPDGYELSDAGTPCLIIGTENQEDHSSRNTLVIRTPFKRCVSPNISSSSNYTRQDHHDCKC